MAIAIAIVVRRKSTCGSGFGVAATVVSRLHCQPQFQWHAQGANTVTHSLRILSYGECPNLGKWLIGSEGNFTSDSSLYLTLTTAPGITTHQAAKMMQGSGLSRSPSFICDISNTYL